MNCFRIYFFAFLYCSALFSNEGKEIVSEQKLDQLGVAELILANGMRVFLKPYDNGENVISLELAACGGYASFPADEETAARVSPDVVWESGLEDKSSDELAAILYDHSIEFNYTVEPFQRYLVGEADSSGFPKLLELVVAFLKKPKFTNEALKYVLTNIQTEISKRERDETDLIESNFHGLNGLSTKYFAPLNSAELQKVTLEKVERAFKTLFGGAAKFVCVIAGDFDLEKMKKLVSEILVELPSETAAPLSLPPIRSHFPKQPETSVLKIKNGTDSLVRMTFQLPFLMQTQNFNEIELMVQTLEAEVRQSLNSELRIAPSIDISFEFPLCPLIAEVWLIVQFRTDPDKAETTSKTIRDELKKIQGQGFTKQATEKSIHSLKTSDEFWQNEDEYWLSFLTNAAILGWNPEDLYVNRKKTYTLKAAQLNEYLKRINFNRYTLFITQPE